MDGIGKIHHRGPGGQYLDVPARGKDIDLVREKVDLHVAMVNPKNIIAIEDPRKGSIIIFRLFSYNTMVFPMVHRPFFYRFKFDWLLYPKFLYKT